MFSATKQSPIKRQALFSWFPLVKGGLLRPSAARNDTYKQILRINEYSGTSLLVTAQARTFRPSRPDVPCGDDIHARATIAKPAKRAKAAKGGFVRIAGGFYPPGGPDG